MHSLPSSFLNQLLALRWPNIMPGVARVNVDNCGGLVIEALVPSVIVNNAPISVTAASVQGHGSGAHGGPKTQAASGNVFAGNKPVNRQGDACTCGDPLTGSSNVFAN